MGPTIHRAPPREQQQLIDWLADYFETAPTVFRKMTPDKRWTIYQRICDKVLYPTTDTIPERVLYH